MSQPHPASPLLCPRCRLGLFVGHAQGVTMHACGRCGGLFLDNASAQRVSSALPDEALRLADSAAQVASARVDTEAVVPCPACQRAMGRTRIAAAKVDVDTCPSHGTWYDRDELRRVAEAMAAIRKGRGAPVGAVVAGVAVAGVAVAGAAAMASSPAVQQQAHAASMSAGDAVEVAVDVADVAIDVVGAVADAGDVAEVGGSLLEGAFELVGGIFSLFD